MGELARRSALYGILLIAVYPLALALAILIDAAFGDLRFFDLFVHESRRRLLTLVLQDWVQAGFWILPLTVLGFLLVKAFPREGGFALLAASLAVLGAALLSFYVPLMLGLVVGLSLAAPLLTLRRRA